MSATSFSMLAWVETMKGTERKKDNTGSRFSTFRSAIEPHTLFGHCYTTHTTLPSFHVTLCNTSDALVRAVVPLPGIIQSYTP